MAIVIPMPGQPPIELQHLALDFTGTLALGGRLLPGVGERLADLAGRIRETVLTADTRGTALHELSSLPVEVRVVRDGAEKARLVRALGPSTVVAIGDGRNDAAMVELAALGIAVLGGEGTAVDVIRAADVVSPSITLTLDQLGDPLRLVATLRARGSR